MIPRFRVGSGIRRFSKLDSVGSRTDATDHPEGFIVYAKEIGSLETVEVRVYLWIGVLETQQPAKHLAWFRPTDRPTDRLKDRPTDRQTDRPTN